MQSFRAKTSRVGRHTLILSVCLTAVLLSASTASAQCRPPDGEGMGLIVHLKRLSSATDEQSGYHRRDLKIPVVDTSTITLVSSLEVCAKVLRAFVASFLPGFSKPLPTSLYVAKVGSVYVGMHYFPEPLPPPGVVRVDGGANVHIVVDSNYNFLSRFGY